MNIPKIFLLSAAFLMLGSMPLEPADAGNAAANTDFHLPPFALHTCVSAEQSLIRNPFSPIANDLLLITTYEESGDAGTDRMMGETPEGRDAEKALNAYLILRVSIVEEQPGALVHEAVLMVTETDKETSPREALLARQWKLLDADGDGRLDRATFSEGEQGATGESTEDAEKEIPSEELGGLQSYFDEAVRHLSRKAADGPGSACTLL